MNRCIPEGCQRRHCLAASMCPPRPADAGRSSLDRPADGRAARTGARAWLGRSGRRGRIDGRGAALGGRHRPMTAAVGQVLAGGDWLSCDGRGRRASGTPSACGYPWGLASDARRCRSVPPPANLKSHFGKTQSGRDSGRLGATQVCGFGLHGDELEEVEWSLLLGVGRGRLGERSCPGSRDESGWGRTVKSASLRQRNARWTLRSRPQLPTNCALSLVSSS